MCFWGHVWTHQAGDTCRCSCGESGRANALARTVRRLLSPRPSGQTRLCSLYPFALWRAAQTGSEIRSETEYEKQNAAIGRFNLAIFGKTGVGKSTLINAIFGEEVARTGIGEPVTRGSHLYLDKVGHLGIVDTQGLEVGKDNKQILAELDKAMTHMRQLPLSEQIHVAWYCLRGMDRRFEEAEADFIRRLDEMGLPVIVVLTQVPMRGGYFHPDAVLLAEQIIAKQLPIVAGRPFMTYAKADEFAGQPAYGLEELLDANLSRCARGCSWSPHLGAGNRSCAEGAGSEQVHNRCRRQCRRCCRHPDPVLIGRLAGADPTWHDGPDRPDLQDQASIAQS